MTDQTPYFWTEADDIYLMENYADSSVEEIASELGRTKSGVENRAKKLCLRKDRKITYQFLKSGNKSKTGNIDMIIEAWETGRGWNRIEETIKLLKDYRKLIEEVRPALIFTIRKIEDLEEKIIKQKM